MEQRLLNNIEDCNANRKWQESIDLFVSLTMSGVALSTRLGNAALLAYSKLSRADDAVALLAAMKEHGVTRDLDSFGRTIAACMKAKEWEQTLVVFAGLDAEELQPGTVLYNSALMACSNSAHPPSERLCIDLPYDCLFSFRAFLHEPNSAFK